MIFRTVYGPELEAIYRFIAGEITPVSRHTIHTVFLADIPDVSTQSVDDALSFLESAGLVVENKQGYRPAEPDGTKSFRVRTLRHLRELELGAREPVQPIDCFYMLILTKLFIRPNQLFVRDVHTEANKLRQVSEAGGLSREKLQAWKRVMEFLGVGQRVPGGFRCAYSPPLLLEIINQWSETGQPLQLFFEDYFSHILPYQTMEGDLALAVAAPLNYLDQTGLIALSSRQDSPAKPYFGERKLRFITRPEVAHAGP